MRDFLTEKETETYLVNETRDIVCSSGRFYPVTASRLFWERLDLLIEARIVTMEQIIEFTHQNVRSSPHDFPTSFQTVVTYIDNYAD